MYGYYLTKEEEKEIISSQDWIIEKEIGNDIEKKVYNLPAISQKSFYGKAKVIESNNGYWLLSYNTIVCYVGMRENRYNRKVPDTVIKLWDGYSVTTMHHINDFFSYVGISILGGKKFWENLKTNKVYNASKLFSEEEKKRKKILEEYRKRQAKLSFYED